MREIKFRGKTELTGEWVYGFYTMGGIVPVEHQDERIVPRYLIDDGLLHDVIPETIGQYTGLTDKNGKEIYEGDILRESPKNEYEKENYTAYEVFWHDNDCASHHIGWQMNRCHFQGNICGTMYIPEFLPKETARMVVIGNIHDHPSLIEKGGEK